MHRRPTDVADWLALLVDARRVVPVLMGGARAVGGRRGRRPAARRARRAGAARSAGRVHRAGRRPARRPRRPLRPHPRAVHRLRGRRSGSGSASPSCQQTLAAARRRRAGCSRASSGRRRRRRVVRRRGAAAGCGAARSPGCATRSSRSSRWRWGASCRPGSTWRVDRRAAQGSRGRQAARRRRRASRWSSSSPAAPCPPPRWSRWCCRRRVRDYQPGDARRADRDRRGALGRPRRAARHRRLGLAAPRRHRPADPARPRRPRALARTTRRCSTPSSGGGAYFFRQLATRSGRPTTRR